MVSPSWCDSSREYRVLLETYTKKFSNPKLNFHSIVVEDPKEKIFDSRLLQELFPNKKKYSHSSVPRFLAIETVQGKTRVYEEGEALQALYKRFFRKHRGFLNAKTSLLRNFRSISAAPVRVQPALGSLTK